MTKHILILISCYICIIHSISAQQAQGEVNGKITTLDGKSVENISVKLKGTGQGTLTDKEGEYSIKRLRKGNYTLLVTAVGLQSQEKNFAIENTETKTIDFTLSENSSELNEITVTASRTNKFSIKESIYASKMPLQKLENPQVFSVVTKELLTEQLIFSVDDAIKNSPGIQKMWEATGRSGDGGSYFNTRGFIVQSSLRNGIAGVVSNSIDAISLEKLEVIKGPSSTLFGSSLSSYGGLINRVTKTPYEKFGGEVAYSIGSFGLNRISADINTPVDRDQKLLFRINTAYNYEDSFQDAGFARNFAAAPSLTYKPNDRLTVNLDAELSFSKNIGKQILFFYFPSAALGVNRADQVNIDYKKSYMGDDLTQTSRSTNLFGQVNYEISDNFTSSTNFTTSYSYSNGFNPYFYLVPNDIVTENPTDAGKANFLTRADQSTRDSKRTLFEIQQNFNGDFNIGSLRNRVVLGLDFLRMNSDQTFFGSVYDIVDLNNNGYDFSSFNRANMEALYANGTPDFTWPNVVVTNTYSAFVSDVLNLTNKFSVLAALRADRFDNKGGTEGAQILAYKQTTFSPKFGIVYQPVQDRVAIFANYQNAFNNKGSYNAFDPEAPTTPIVRNAKPEQANQIEGGVKLDAFNGKLSGTVSYYDIRVKNVLRADPRAAAVAQVQDGTQISKGIEFEVITNPIEGLNIIAGFSYNDSKMDKADPDVNGRRPTTASSPYLANFWISYRLPETAIKGLGLGFGGNYASDNKILNSISMGEFTLPAYTVFSATAFYDRPKYRVSLKADNLTDERYWIGYTTMNPQKTRSYAASLCYKF